MLIEETFFSVYALNNNMYNKSNISHAFEFIISRSTMVHIVTYDSGLLKSIIWNYYELYCRLNIYSSNDNFVQEHNLSLY